MSMRTWAVRAMIFILAVTAVAMGCTQKLGVTAPSAPRITPTHTAGGNTATPSFTRTHTPTYTPTVTYTHTPMPSATSTFTPSPTWTPTDTSQFTDTPTDTWEFSPTFTDSPTDTDTFTMTPTYSPTFTITFTFTSTPTTPVPVDPNMIDNMEDGDPQILTHGTPPRSGYWFDYNDGTAGSITTSPATVMSPNGNPGNCARMTGSGYTDWGAGMGFNFVPEISPGVKDVYDASGYTGVIFDIRVEAGSSTNIRFEVAAPSTNSDTAHFGTDLTVGTTWQSVTIFFNLMQQPSWGTPATWDPSQVYGLQWKAPAGSPFDVLVDNIQFTNIQGPTPTPSPTADSNLIDNCEDGDGQISVQNGRNGDWFTMTDGNSGGDSTVSPTEGSEFTMTAGGANSTAFHAQITGLLGPTYPYRFVGVGCNMVRPAQPTDPKIAYDASAYTGFTFMVRNDGAATLIRVSVTTVDTDPDGGICAPASMCNNNYGVDFTVPSGTWQAVTVFFNLMAQEPAWGYTPPGGFNPVSIYGIQWQVKGDAGLAVDFSVDDVRFVTEVGPTPTPSPTADAYLLDNLEDNDNQINVTAGRDGFWYTFFDGTETGSQWVTVASRTTIWPEDPPFPPSAPGADVGSPLYAANMTGTVGSSCGSPYNTCPFAGMGFDFVNAGEGNPKILYDVSAFRGISFYAKNAEAGLAVAWRVKMPDYFTTTVAEGGDCPSACSDNFGWPLGSPRFDLPVGSLDLINPGLQTTWQQYQMPFIVFAQEGWGHQPLPADVATCNGTPGQPYSGCLDLTKVFGLQWQLSNSSASQNYNYWMDDIRLVP